MNNSALQRLAYKAGATRVSSEVYNRIRTIGDQYLSSIVQYASEHEKRRQFRKTMLFTESNMWDFLACTKFREM